MTSVMPGSARDPTGPGGIRTRFGRVTTVIRTDDDHTTIDGGYHCRIHAQLGTLGAMTDDAVRVRGLRFGYGAFLAVDGVDLDLGEGELLALLGTNGAGKTTTLEVIEGHRRADAGEVRVLGLDPYANRRRLAGDVSAMLQESGFAGDLTVAETLGLWRSLHPGRNQAGSSALAAVELEHRRDVRVQQLSGGERRRLDLALAISTDPRLLLLDEPTTGMDPAARERTWELLRGLLSRGRSLLLTTHYLEEAETLADQVAIMHEGRIAIHGTVQQIVATRPATISCQLPAGVTGGELPGLAGTIRLSGPDLEIRTAGLQADLHRLLSWARDRDIELQRLRATEASLAEVFADVQAAGTSRSTATEPAGAGPAANGADTNGTGTNGTGTNGTGTPETDPSEEVPA